MKKALMIAPAASVLRNFCSVNIKCLKELGYEIHLAANFEDEDEKKQKQYDEFLKKCKSDGINAINIKFYRKSLFKNLATLRTLRMMMKDFDVIHCHTETGGMLSSLVMPKAAKKIYTPHGISFYKGSSRLSWAVLYPIEKWICSRMDSVLTINREEYDIISRWKNNDTKFVHGIGMDTEAFKSKAQDVGKRNEFGIADDDFFVLCVGELNENKNHKVIIKAIADNPKIKCVICGIGYLEDELIKLIDDSGLSERVFLAGYRTDIAELMACADVFAFPSFHEGLPVSVMEAMTMGLPVVCSKIRGNVDLIEDGVGGFLCEPTDVESFKKAIKVLAGNAELREKMSAVNKENVKSYDISAVEKEIYDVYGDKK